MSLLQAIARAGPLLALMFAAGDSNADGQHRFALIAGNDQGGADTRPLRYATEDARKVHAVLTQVGGVAPVDAPATMAQLREVLSEAEAFVMQMPTEKAGLLFLKDGHVVQPDPGCLDEYQAHAGRRRGQWPTSFEISTAMLEHYNKPPTP